VAHRLHHHLSQVRLRRLVQFSSIGFQFHTRTTHHALFGAPVSNGSCCSIPTSRCVLRISANVISDFG
ncbi:hypothetical protein, partial [Burkholderia ubonensis]|uniref:hypothetical protein n=1 Tax=Burkholderia ubonensis TaxID=101571 RepID=UPI001E52C54E